MGQNMSKPEKNGAWKVATREAFHCFHNWGLLARALIPQLWTLRVWKFLDGRSGRGIFKENKQVGLCTKDETREKSVAPLVIYGRGIPFSLCFLANHQKPGV